MKKCKKQKKIIYGIGAPVKGNAVELLKINTKLIPMLLEKNNLEVVFGQAHIPIKMEDNVKNCQIFTMF